MDRIRVSEQVNSVVVLRGCKGVGYPTHATPFLHFNLYQITCIKLDLDAGNLVQIKMNHFFSYNLPEGIKGG